MLATAPSIARPLEGPYDTPPLPEALRPTPATQHLVRSQVRALLMSSPAFFALPAEERRSLENGLVRVADYAAECLREVCWHSERLGQRPLVRKRQTVVGPLARSQAADFRPAAANQVARVTQETLRAVAFPTFVADLIRSTFNAIIQSSIQQMEAFSQLLSNVSKTVDQFMADNISDNQAHDWLAQRFPEHIRIREGRAAPREGADELPLPDFQRELNLSEGVGLDEDGIESVLVPAARRRLAESRLQLLSTMVLMGVNRIVITGGKIRATMGFHIDTTDRAREEQASDFDFRTGASGSFGFGPWQAAASMSISYVRSTRASSDAELNVDTDLTGEVELHFRSDYFPLQRFAPAATIGRIQQNTAVPDANAPVNDNPLGSGVPAAGGDVPRYTSPRTRRSERPTPVLPPIGSPLPPPRLPDRPLRPEDLHPEREEAPAAGEAPAEEEAAAVPPPGQEGGDADGASEPADTGDSGEARGVEPPATASSWGGIL